jgi:hypothetical protein
VIESTTRDSLQFFQQLGQTDQIRPKSLQLQFGQRCDDNSARNTNGIARPFQVGFLANSTLDIW